MLPTQPKLLSIKQKLGFYHTYQKTNPRHQTILSIKTLKISLLYTPNQLKLQAIKQKLGFALHESRTKTINTTL